MNHANEAVRLLELLTIGPSALARAAGVAKSTAAAWRAGIKKPGTVEVRVAVELALRIPREAWDRAPGRFQTEGQLHLWLALDPRCRGCDGHCGEAGRAPCPVDAASASSEPAA
jgi:hypothetical protein